ncbi:PREDICTED: spermatogenesis-associated protein 19, mitochondrial [Pygoscelis adeliae]|uniref:spermatogenesis-associated protein 19, mitochondrial n=1 Tax=Pygoscelis adeliae TaxID=9238 RepID=UPI0004F4DBC7|nr:PREDICTED: spermatogenesis-associated protein 19, mitochondrial [Pygoscelis adeliae]
MIISTWLVYITARKGIGAPFLSAGTRVEDGTSRFFRWMLAGAEVQRAESASAPPACLAVSGLDPQVGIRGLSVAVPHGGVWELGKDDVAVVACPLGRSLSHSFLEDRTTIQLLRQSMSRLVLQAKPDTKPDTEPDTNAQVLLSSED